MKTIIITDTHYGVKNNSKLWCDYQIKFIDNTLIPLIKKLQQNDTVRIIHCGDVFDSKDKLNTYIIHRVLNKFEEILKLCKLYIIAGNHDFYSTSDDTICSISLLFRGLQCDNLNYITQGFYADEQTKELFLPFFSTENDDKLKEVFDCIDFKPEIIYCHTDLEHSSPVMKELFKNSKIISGHIHIPCIHDNYYTIGSTYALNFADSNTPRGCYVMDDNDVENMVFIENKDSLNFWRFYDSQIFDINESLIKGDDYIELYINKKYLIEDKYIDRVNYITRAYSNSEVIPNDVESTQNESECVEMDNYDIVNIIKSNIPAELQSKFEIIENSIKDIL